MPYDLHNNFIANNFRDLGIFNLKASASAQFNEDELKNIVANYPDKKITIIDLRLEYHGFVNGEPLTLRNFKLSSETFDQQQEKNILTEFVNNNSNLTIFNNSSFKSTNDNEIIEILIEEELAKKYQCNYQRFPLKDHHFPDHQQFLNIIKFLEKIEANQASRIHVHCAAGRGRTAILLAIYDIFKNHHHVEIAEIFNRQARLGSANLANIANENEWSLDQKQNIQMLYDFYKQLNQN